MSFVITCEHIEQAVERATEDARDFGAISSYIYSVSQNKEWMEEAYPCRRGVGSGGTRKGVERKPKSSGEMRKLKPEQIVVPLKVPESLQSKWLMGRYAA